MGFKSIALKFGVEMSMVEMSPNLFLAVNVNQHRIEFRSGVNESHDHGLDFYYEIDTEYHIETSQSKENGIVTFRILINDQIMHSTINDDPSAILLFSKLLKKIRILPRSTLDLLAPDPFKIMISMVG